MNKTELMIVMFNVYVLTFNTYICMSKEISMKEIVDCLKSL